MDELRNSHINSTKLPKDPYGPLPSGALCDFCTLEQTMETTNKKSNNQIASTSCVHCGNGNIGCGSVGERQVNNTNEDINLKPRVTQSETSLARFYSYILFGFNDSNVPGNFAGFGFSSDSGVTWCDCGNLPQNPPWNNGGDPVIGVDYNGVFYYATLGILPDFSAGIIQISTGTVNPMTRKLTMNRPFVAGVGALPTSFEDKEWIAVGRDPMRGHCAQSIYVTWTDFPDVGPSTIRFSKWTTGVTPSLLIASKTISSDTDVQGSFPVVDRNGFIYVFYEQFLAGLNSRIRMVKSTDGGNSFSTPITVADIKMAANAVVTCGTSNRPVIQVTPTKVIRTNEFPHAAVGPDGTLYVVYNSGSGDTLPQTQINIYLAYSTDQGNTWNVRQITANTAYSFMPSVIANNSGAHIQYSRFDGTSGIGNGRFALFMKSFSIIRGLSDEKMVSTVFSLVPDTRPNFDPGVASCYMGDYNQIIRGPELSLYHAWGDNRNDIYNGNNPDVFFIETNPCPMKCC